MKNLPEIEIAAGMPMALVIGMVAGTLDRNGFPKEALQFLKETYTFDNGGTVLLSDTEIMEKIETLVKVTWVQK